MNLTKRLSKQSIYEGLLLILPTYFLLGQYIIVAGIILAINTFHLSLSYNELNIFLNFFFDLGMLLFVVIVFRKELFSQTNEFRDWDLIDIGKELLIGIPILYLVNIGGGYLSYFLSGVSNSVNQTSIETMMSDIPIFTIISAVLFAPIVEEIIYRLFMFSAIYPKSPLLAYVVSGFLFGFMHVSSSVLAGDMGEMVMIFPYLFMGIGLCYFYDHSDNICIPILCHAILNLISVILMFI